MVFLTGSVMYLGLFKKEHHYREKIINICVIGGVLIAMPIPLFSHFDHLLYLGYIGINVLHNPTVIMLKPFALILLILFCKNVISNNSRNLLFILVLVVISALVKPNFIMCFIPAIIVFFISKKDRNTALVVNTIGVVVTGLLVLLWQFLFTYTGSHNDAGVKLAPFLVYTIYSSLWFAPFKLLLSIAFPLSVLIFYWRCVKDNIMIQLSLLSFIASLPFYYLMAEYPLPDSANFWWGSQVTLFILFASTASFFTGSILNPKLINSGLIALLQAKILIPLILFFAQIISGLNYYCYALSGHLHW